MRLIIKRIAESLILALLLISGCSNLSVPEKVVKTIFEGIEEGDITKIESVLSKDNIEKFEKYEDKERFIEISQEFIPQRNEIVKYIGCQDNSRKRIDCDNTQENDIQVLFEITYSDGMKEVETVDVIRENGLWKYDDDLID